MNGGFGAATNWLTGFSATWGPIRMSQTVTGNNGAFLGWQDGVSLDTMELLGMKGDGLPDQIVAWNNTGGDGIADLPFNLWTVTRIERDDGMCDANGATCLRVTGAAHTVATTYHYWDGRYDPTDREFRGFGGVTTTTYDTTTHIYPYTVRQPTVVKPAPEPSVTIETATQYHLRCGKLASQTIAYLSGADPDNPAETVVYGFDAAGQVVSLKNTNTTPTWYLSNLTYDVFGRPRVITHGNGTTDTHTYGDQTANFRLATIETELGSSTTYLKLSYATYSATGLLTQLTDLRDSSGQLANTATFSSDGLGRLTAR